MSLPAPDTQDRGGNLQGNEVNRDGWKHYGIGILEDSTRGLKEPQSPNTM